MPIICEFRGIKIRMYHDDHPSPHFHAKYNEFYASFDFEGNITVGELPSPADTNGERMGTTEERGTESELGTDRAGPAAKPDTASRPGTERTLEMNSDKPYYPRVIDVKVVEHYVIEVTFTNGTRRRIDLRGRLKNRGPVFQPLHDPQFFAQMTLGDETVEWPNGADIAPETLYEIGELIDGPAAPVQR
jgi:hypothetical protein